MKTIAPKYTERGLALDGTARLESLKAYQEAINMFDKGLKDLKVPGVPVKVRVKELGLKGSFCKGRGRIGTYRDLSFEAVDEMQRWGKISLKRSFPKSYMGRDWSGSISEISDYPSDLDVFLTHYSSEKQLSIVEGWSVDDEIKGLTKKIFDKTGVYIQFSNVHNIAIEDKPYEIPFNKVTRNKFIKMITRRKSKNKAGGQLLRS